jgi:hypothetical protein
MFAIIAAVLFGLALLLELLDETIGDVVTPQTLMLAGLMFVALHLLPGRRGWRR